MRTHSARAIHRTGLLSAALSVFLACFIAGPAFGQALPIDKITPPLPSASARRAADVASWGTVLTALALDTRASWQAPERGRAFGLQAARLGVTYGVSYLVKSAVARQRPCAMECGIDDSMASFYSAHTAAAFQTMGGGSASIVLPLALGTGGLRVAAGKHYLTDVLAGAAAGLLTSRLR